MQTTTWGAEHEVLGSVLIDDQIMDQVETVLVDRDFQSPRHQILYRAMVHLYEKNEPINAVSVTELLLKKNQLDSIGGVVYLNDLSNGVATTAQVDYFLNVIKENSLKRRLLQTTEEIRRKVNQGDFDDIEALISYSEEAISQVRNNRTKGLSPVAERVVDHIERLEQAKTQSGIKGHSSGFPTFDKLTSGLCDGQLIIMAARPGVGKTTALLHFANEISVKKGLPVGFFALEMTEDELVDKMLSNITDVPHTLINNGLVDRQWEPLTYGFAKLKESGLNIDDTPAVTMNYIAAESRKLKRRHGQVGAIMIDYLQLVEPATSGSRRASTRDQEIGLITRRAKQLAKELSCPVIMACQMSRDIEKRNVKRPMLSDLRESGNIEQDANVVCFIHDDPEKEDLKVNGEPMRELELIIAKNRSGGLGTIPIIFRRTYQRLIERGEVK